jgi:hypothetical protein
MRRPRAQCNDRRAASSDCHTIVAIVEHGAHVRAHGSCHWPSRTRPVTRIEFLGTRGTVRDVTVVIATAAAAKLSLEAEQSASAGGHAAGGRRRCGSASRRLHGPRRSPAMVPATRTRLKPRARRARYSSDCTCPELAPSSRIITICSKFIWCGIVICGKYTANSGALYSGGTAVVTPRRPIRLRIGRVRLRLACDGSTAAPQIGRPVGASVRFVWSAPGPVRPAPERPPHLSPRQRVRPSWPRLTVARPSCRPRSYFRPDTS